MELYETTTNGTKPSTVSLNHMGHPHGKGITESSVSEGDDELNSNKSEDRFTAQTDYEMVCSEAYICEIYYNFFSLQEIPSTSMMALNGHHHNLNMLPNGFHIQTGLPQGTMRGMSTYLLDESTVSNQPPLPMQYNPFTLRHMSQGMTFYFVFFCFAILQPILHNEMNYPEFF